MSDTLGIIAIRAISRCGVKQRFCDRHLHIARHPLRLSQRRRFRALSLSTRANS